jgi:hypothetical protein
MNEKTISNPKGSGVVKSEARRVLSQYNLIEMTKYYSFSEIARRLSVTESMEHAVANEQYSDLQVRSFESSDYKVDHGGLKDAWMLSKERQSYKNYNYGK